MASSSPPAAHTITTDHALLYTVTFVDVQLEIKLDEMITYLWRVENDQWVQLMIKFSSFLYTMYLMCPDPVIHWDISAVPMFSSIQASTTSE